MFHLLGVSGSLDAIGWDGPEREKLWRYNQHYFDDLNAENSASRREWHRALLAAWIEGNPPGRGVGWEPYPTSLRIVNWVKLVLLGDELSAEAEHSLAVQARWLLRRVEWHLLGNHIFANAKALVFAGLYFRGAEAEAWLEAGFRILRTELSEQILADGGQFERSTLYHALALEDVLDLLNVARRYPQALSAEHRSIIERAETLAPLMRRWLHAMCHPDGRIAFFNDAAFGVAPSEQELNAYASRLGLSLPEADEPAFWMRDSGYLRAQVGKGVLLADMAPIGPNYLPGHAHADTLSFEFSLGPQRIFVNSGTSLYGNGPERLRQRGTSAHNTVVVEGQDSSEVWGGFRVARRAMPLDATVEIREHTVVARASHDGYRRLGNGPLHTRCWTLSPGRLVVEDRLDRPGLAAFARYHLHPDIRFDRESAHTGLLTRAGLRLARLSSPAEIAEEPTTWHPEFGTSVPTTCLVTRLPGRGLIDLRWS